MEEYTFQEIMLGFYDGPHATPPISDSGPIFLGIKNINEKGGLLLNEIRHIASKDYSKWTKRVVPAKDDIVFSYEATLHRYALIPEGFIGCLGRRMALIRCNTSLVNPVYLYYHLLSPYWKAFVNSVKILGATVDRLSIIDFPKYKVSLPPLPTQKKIASILSAYDDLIENNTQRIKILEEMAEEIYKEWFVRMRFPGWQDAVWKDKDGNVVQRGSEGGLPEGWEEKSLFDISNILYGFPFASSKFNSVEGVPIVRIRDIKNNYSSTFTTQKPPEQYRIKDGDILVGMDGDFHTGIWSGPTSYLNQRVVKFTANENISKYFLFYSVRKEVSFLNKIISGTTVAHLSDRDLKKIKVIVPSNPILEKYKNLVDSKYELAILLNKKNKVLQETRDLLLPRLISGKLDVSEIV